MTRTKKHLALTNRPAAAESQDLAAQLRELMDLHQAGVLTSAELAVSRARLLWTPRLAPTAARRANPARPRQLKAS